MWYSYALKQENKRYYWESPEFENNILPIYDCADFYSHDEAVIDKIAKSKGYSPFGLEKKNYGELHRMGFSDSEINIIIGTGSPYTYATTNWNWIRVSGDFIQAYELDKRTLRRIADVILNIHGDLAFNKKIRIRFDKDGIEKTAPFEVFFNEDTDYFLR